ncbi:hypothetical protein DB42_EL00190 [Neochlamydia sp. EPS4]|nr:hypothetical protein DB42_EL00190 [Neochlamydia sp. EPS4]
MGSDNFFSIFIFQRQYKKLKKQVKPIRNLINENNSQMIYQRFFSDRFAERVKTFQAFRSSRRYWGLSDAAILVWLKEWN